MAKKNILGLVAVLLSAFLLAGCSLDSVNNSFHKYSGLNIPAINLAEETKDSAENYNPVFDSEEGIVTPDPVAKPANEIFKKSLGDIFIDSKLISVQSAGTTPFIMKYMVKRKIEQKDGELLFDSLIKADSKAKDDRLPHYYDARNTVEFSVYHNFGGRSYIINVFLDLGAQVIWVNVY